MNVWTSTALREDDATSSSTCAPWTSATLSRQPNGCAHSTARHWSCGPKRTGSCHPSTATGSPNCSCWRLIEIPDGYTLIPEDQPDERARIIRESVRDTP